MEYLKVISDSPGSQASIAKFCESFGGMGLVDCGLTAKTKKIIIVFGDNRRVEYPLCEIPCYILYSCGVFDIVNQSIFDFLIGNNKPTCGSGANTDQVSQLAIQVGGSHYKDMAIQPVEFIHRNGIGFIEGCCIKYLCRWRSKNGVEDLKKAKHFIDMLIEMEEKK